MARMGVLDGIRKTLFQEGIPTAAFNKLFMAALATTAATAVAIPAAIGGMGYAGVKLAGAASKKMKKMDLDKHPFIKGVAEGYGKESHISALGLGNFAKGAGTAVWHDVKIADKIGGELFDVMARDTRTGGWNPLKPGKEYGYIPNTEALKNYAHVGMVNALPVGLIALGATRGRTGAELDIKLGEMQLTQFADTIYPGATPNINNVRNNPIYNRGSRRVGDFLDASLRNMPDSAGADGELALAAAKNAIGGGIF